MGGRVFSFPGKLGGFVVSKLLVVSYHFPPYSGGATIRIHNFVKYLPGFGVKPMVLTVQDKYYPTVYRNEQLLNEFDDSVEIFRTGSLEPAAHGFRDKVYGVQERGSADKILISVLKKAVSPFLIPDREVPWLPYAVRAGTKVARSMDVDAVFSTGPPFTSHLVAYLVAKRTRLPLILDYRDDWVGNEYYDWGNPLRKKFQRYLERRIVRRADKVICASAESINLFRTKYPDIDSSKYVHISNGFDPALFGMTKERTSDKPTEVTQFVYTGSLTPKRTPKYFLQALKKLVEEQPELADKLRVRFIGYSPLEHERLVESMELSSAMKFEQNISPRQVAEVLADETDVCLLFQRQSEGGNTAIPGKVYEYLACRKPILCMADGGATVNLLRDELGCRLISPYEDVDDIKRVLEKIVHDYDRVSTEFDWSEETLRRFSRKEQAKQLGALISEVVTG
jgi:glycosyltransferase involved in cell wall biosynthesis